MYGLFIRDCQSPDIPTGIPSVPVSSGCCDATLPVASSYP